MTPKEFLKLVDKDVNFQEAEYLNDDNFEEYIINTRYFYCDHGASKIVFIPKDIEENPFVIKVPFNSDGDACYNSDDEPSYDFFCYAKDSKSEYEGAEWDYCGLEAFYYEQAKKAHVEKFFAKTEFLGWLGDYPAYVQPYCEIDSDATVNTTHEEREMAKELYYELGYLPNISWIAGALRDSNPNDMVKLNQFIKEWNISDLRYANIGACRGHNVLVDYSAYNEA